MAGEMYRIRPLRPGEVLGGRYKVLHELGRGGFGAVYKVEDQALNDHFLALKEMDAVEGPGSPRGGRETMLANFKREALTLLEIHHTNIPRAYYQEIEEGTLVCLNCGETFLGKPTCPECRLPDDAKLFKPVFVPKRCFLLMDFIEGPTLEEKLAEQGRPLAEAEAAHLMAQVCGAVGALHEKNMIHRDVKPENIIVEMTSQKAFLVDLGLVKAEHAVAIGGKYGTQVLDNRKTAVLGTPGYAPPEQEAGRPEKRSDIYSLGMTLARLVTLVDPMDDRQLQDLREIGLSSFHPGLSRSLGLIITRAIRPDPDTRYQQVEEMQQDLARLARPVSDRQVILLTTPDGQEVRELSELARVADVHSDAVKKALFDGSLAENLEDAGLDHAASAARDVEVRFSNYDAGLEEFLQKSVGGLELPRVAVQPPRVNLGVVAHGEGRVEELTISNTGRGYLRGTVRLKGTYRGVEVRPASIEGNTCRVWVQVDTNQMIPDTTVETELLLETNGDPPTVSVPLAFRVGVSLQALGSGVLGMPLAPSADGAERPASESSAGSGWLMLLLFWVVSLGTLAYVMFGGGPTSAGEWIQTANRYFTQKRYAEARQAYDRALLLEPSRSAFIAMKIGRCEEQMGHFDDAIASYEKANREGMGRQWVRNRVLYNLYFHRAQELYRQGHTNQAAQKLRRALELGIPQNEAVKRLFWRISKAKNP